MRVFIVGSCDPGYEGDKDYEGFDWIVCNYWEGSYEGGGESMGWKDGQLYHWRHDHCSCYGPLEVDSPELLPIEQFREELEWATSPYDSDVVRKVCELLQIN